jgi:hypothetical protein
LAGFLLILAAVAASIYAGYSGLPRFAVLTFGAVGALGYVAVSNEILMLVRESPVLAVSVLWAIQSLASAALYGLGAVVAALVS